MRAAEQTDLVYAWVDGAFPGYLEERQAHSSTPTDMNPERYRDSYQCLKYSLRSVARYLPWITNIFILTNRPQVPDWLNTDHPNVHVVHLDRFIPKAFLPTFSSNTIESFLHQIPGLAEHFIYMNDDFFFGNDTFIEDFYLDGKYTIFNTLIGENLKWRVYGQKHQIYGTGLLFGLSQVEHGPLFARKIFWREMCEMHPRRMYQTRMRKFRHPDNLVTYKLYRSYMLGRQRQISRPIPIWKFLKISVFHKITNDLKATRRGLRKITARRPKFFCLNDDQADAPNPDVETLVKAFLSSQFPDPSPFERAQAGLSDVAAGPNLAKDRPRLLT